MKTVRLLLVASLFAACSSSSTSKPDGGAAGTGGGKAGADGGMAGTGTAGTGSAGTGSAGTGSAGTGAAGTGAAGTATDGGAAGADASTDVAADGGGSACANVDTTSLVATPGTSLAGQSFDETRAIEVTPISDAMVTALVLQGLSANAAGTVGARIYDATTQALVASANKSVAMGDGQTVEVPVSATLTAGKKYRVGFYVHASANGDLFTPTAATYTAGNFKIGAIGESGDDAYPGNVNLGAPKMSIKACHVAAPDGGTDAATTDASQDVVATSDAGGTCNAVEPVGPAINKTTHAGAAPAMTGGTIVAGTYVLTAMDKYNGTQGDNTHRETWVFSAGHVEIASQDSTKGNVIAHYSGSYVISGTNSITLTTSCPAVMVVPTAQYTATATTLQLLGEPASSDQEVHVFTKQ